jgi:two-component system NtrC family response regulator
MNNQRRGLLVVEDDPGLQAQYRWSFDAFDLAIVKTREQALADIRRREPPVVLLDLGLPPDPQGTSEGFAALEDMQRLAPYTKVIVITGQDDHDNAVRAVGMGAYDFYSKPIDIDTLDLVLRRAYRMHDLEVENRRLSQEPTPFDGLITGCGEMQEICRLVEMLAPTDATTLLLGESGTGKGILARGIHTLSSRKEGPFVTINCASIPEALLESELFGYERGAFTGAIKQKQGRIESACGGTLFLDEIGDLSVALQAKLLRFLQERVIERIGGGTEIPIDVRVVCATNQDLEALIEREGFRRDLYYRISEITLTLPPLRDRSGDAVLIARSIMRRGAEQNGRKACRLTSEAISAIEDHSWPGNVRELQNKMKRAMVFSEGIFVTAKDLDLAKADQDPPCLNLREVRKRAEIEAIQRAISSSDGNITKTAALLGISRPTLYDLWEKYGLRVPRQRIK